MKCYLEKSISVMSDKDCAEEEYCFISTQSFCCTSDGTYLPAEIGMTKYSIANGIVAEYHDFIAPGEIPLGYRYACQENSERGHKIPVAGFENANSNYSDIVDKINNFVNNDEQDDDVILYCFVDEMKQTETIVNRWLMNRVNASLRRNYRIFDISLLLGQLYGRFSTYSLSVIQNEWMRSTAFTYNPSTSCSWHWDNEVYVCALGTVKCFCYIFSDHLCQFYKVDILPGCHFPAVENKYSRASSNHSVASNYGGRFSSNASFTSERTCSSPYSKTSTHSTLNEESDLDAFNYQCSIKNTSESLCDGASDIASVRSVNSSMSGYTGKSFASAAMGRKNVPFSLGADDFPDLGGGSRVSPVSSVNDTFDSENSDLEAKKAALRSRGLGRGRFVKPVSSDTGTWSNLGSRDSRSSAWSSTSETSSTFGRGRGLGGR
ncbi:hypothetical protein CHUAL_007666 [Chamberlinius hualienensis]